MKLVKQCERCHDVQSLAHVAGSDTIIVPGHPYPHNAHRCWAKGMPAAISRRRQAQHCLRDAHTRCPIFMALIPREQIPVHPETAPTQALIALLDEPPRRRTSSRPQATTPTRATHGHLLRKLQSQLLRTPPRRPPRHAPSHARSTPHAPRGSCLLHQPPCRAAVLHSGCGALP